LKHEDTVYFFIQSRSGLTVIGVTTSTYPIFSTQKFVRSLKTQWQRGTGKDKKVIQKEIEQWNRVDNENNPLLKIQNDTVVVKEKMMKNIDHIIENLEKLDNIESKSEDLSKNAGSLQKKTNTFKWAILFENIKLIGILCCVLVFVVIIGVWLGCGFPDFKRCRQQGN